MQRLYVVLFGLLLTAMTACGLAEAGAASGNRERAMMWATAKETQ